MVLAGASGLVGGALLDQLLADESVLAVHALVRRDLGRIHGKLITHLVDFGAIAPLPPIDEAYLALGTTIKTAGSQAAFRAVDFDANLAVAHAALAAGARHIGLVSSMGADAKSRVFYSRVKGELEDAIAALPFEGIVIARPSLLLGDRSSLGQRPRPAEKLSMVVGKRIGWLLPANYRPIEASQVATALLKHVAKSQGLTILSSASLQASGVDMPASR